MKIQVSTTPEQSQRLIACGVDTATADMCYIGHHLDSIPYEGMLAQWMGDSAMKGRNRRAEDFDLSPAWSLSALLALLPMEIRKGGIDFIMELKPYPHEEECYRWCISYYDNELEVTAYYSEAPTPIEACVRMVEKLTDNGYKLNEL